MQQIFNKKVIQKIMALFVILVLSNFIMSTRVYAEYAAASQDPAKETTTTSPGYAAASQDPAKDSTSDTTSSSGDFEDTESDGDIWGILFSPFTALFIGIADGVNYILRTAIVGNKAIDGQSYKVVISGSRAEKYMENDYMKDKDETTEPPTAWISKSGIDHSTLGGITYYVSTIDYTPAEIFAGRISALNANFFKTDQEYDNLLGGKNKSIVESLRDVVSNWYVAIRNIAIVGLMSVLLYMGIRIVISSSSNDKAKYKQMLVDWIVALCLIFFMHYIMAFTMTVSEQIIKVFTNDDSGAINQCMIRLYSSFDENGPIAIEKRQWHSNFVNVARMKTQYDNLPAKFGYTALYFAFTGYTVYFTIVYLKRLLMLAFYTMIAPAVALTYPLDKIRDGKAQAFNFWLKDYIFYAFLPVLHMLLYTVFVSSALDLATKNMIYAIFAMAFIVPAEKIVKKMFHIQGNTEDRIGGFAGGALASSLFNLMRKPPKPPKGAPGMPREEKVPTIPKSSNTVDGGANLAVAKPWDLVDTKAQEAKDDKDKAKTAQTGTPKQVTQPDPNAQVDQNSEEDSNNPQISTQSTEPVDGSTEPDPNAQPAPGIDQNVQPVSEPDQNIPQTYVGDTSMNLDSYKEHKENKVVRKIKNTPRVAKQEFDRRLKLAGGGDGLKHKIGKGVVKAAFTVGKVGTTIGGAAMGVGLGMVGGDVSDVIKYGIAGASAGMYFGNKVGNGAIDTISKAGKNFNGSFAADVLNGGHEEHQRKVARKNYINNRDNLERIAAKHEDFDADQVKEWAAREFDIQYATGVDNAKFADKALKMEDKYREAYKSAGYSDEEAATNASQIAQGALARTDDWSKSELNDRKKRDGYVADLAEQYVDKGVSNANVARMYAENEIDLTRMIYGQKEMNTISVPKKGESSQPAQSQQPAQPKQPSQPKQPAQPKQPNQNPNPPRQIRTHNGPSGN